MKIETLFKPLICLPVLTLSVAGCNKESENVDNVLSDKVTTINVSGMIGNEIPGSKAHWDESEGKPIFYWDNTTDEMKAAVVGSSGFKNFKNSGKISGIDVSVVSGESNRLKANLSVQDELSVNYETGDKFYAFSPVKDGVSSVSADGDDIVFQMNLPLELTQKSSDETAHISQYVFMEGKGDVNVSRNVASTEIGFNILPTLFCFNVSNEYFDNLVIESVSIEGNINNSAVMTVDASKEENLSIQYSGAEKSQKYTVKSDGISIGKNNNITIYGLAFPTTINSGSSIKFEFNGSYDGGQKLNIEKTITLTEPMEFKSNYYQIFNMPISMTGMDVNWNVSSWGPITETPVTGTSDTIGTEGSVGSWNNMTENNVTANESVNGNN